MAKTPNYTPEMVDTAVTMYQAGGNTSLDTIATELGRTVRSVRSKLVREGVYIADVKPEAAPRDLGPTKKELLNSLEDKVNFDVTGLAGATKEAISHILALATSNDEVETV